MDVKELTRLYNELGAIYQGTGGLAPGVPPALQVVRRYNQIIEQVAIDTKDDVFRSYAVEIHQRQGSSIQSARSSDLRTNSYMAQKLLHENYLDQNTIPPKAPTEQQSQASSPVTQTFQQIQENSQQTEVSVEFTQTIITLTEVLTRKEAEYEEGTPENGFIKKLKSMLAGAKSGLDVLTMVLGLASQYGLTVEQLHKLLS